MQDSCCKVLFVCADLCPVENEERTRLVTDGNKRNSTIKSEMKGVVHTAAMKEEIMCTTCTV